VKIHQIAARLEYGDAVSKHVLGIDRALNSWGYETDIFANTTDEFGASVARPDGEYAEHMGAEGDLLIYHYSVYCSNYRQYLETKNRRILIYHNITPPEYFAPYDKGVAEFCRLGRELLPKLTGCDLALGDSEYNRLELVELGFDPEMTGVLPIFVNYDGLLGCERDKGIISLYEGSFKVLFVGRSVPNKRIEDVLRAFLYYDRCIDSSSQLFIVGPSWVDRYDEQLRWLADSFGLMGKVHFTGRVSDAELATYYEASDLFLSMSEHEGFAVPLVESMAFGLPILAYSSTAIPYTLEGAGLTFAEKDPAGVGELMEIVRSDEEVRNALVESERERLAHFSNEAVSETLREALARALGEAP